MTKSAAPPRRRRPGISLTGLSLTVRAAVLSALILCSVTVMLGTYFYQSVKSAMDRRVEILLASRLDHFSRLIREMYTVTELRDRPLLIANMLGAERDVLVFREIDGTVLTAVNPDGLPLPTLPPPEAPSGVAAGVANARESGSLRTILPNGVPIVWAWAQTQAVEDGRLIQILGGHPMAGERQMLNAYRARIVVATLVALLVGSALAFAALRHGLRPVRTMAARAADIAPGKLDLRFDVATAPGELRALAGAINAMLDRLASGYRHLSQFSADLAHEIRTPLGILIGQTQVALAQPRTIDDYQQILESNLEELDRLHRLSENLLFLARADNASAPLERQDLSLAMELRKIADYFEGPAAERGIRFVIEAAGTVCANPDLCRRAISNLVVNAVRHGAGDEVVRLVGTVEEKHARIIVENRGSSLNDDEMGRLFDRFYRADPARSVATESHGLGLAIVKTIMVRHGGRAEASRPQPGLFRVCLTFPQ